MAKERNLPSKSTLTTSDYIRVVGSDNASYKQGISSVMTTMGIGRAVSYGDLASFYADFSAMAVDTKYFVSTWGNCSTALGLPSATYKGYATKSSATLCDMTVQTYGASGANVEYIGRVTFDSSGAVTATNWTKQPTRAEYVSGISSDYGTVSSNSTIRIGNVVLVSLRLTLTSNAAAYSQIIKGIPTSDNTDVGTIFSIKGKKISGSAISGDVGLSLYRNSSTLSSWIALSNGDVVDISGCYLAKE